MGDWIVSEKIGRGRAVRDVVAVSVEALVFIVIGRSCSEGWEFDSHSPLPTGQFSEI